MKLEQMKIKELLDTSHTIAEKLFEGHEYPWEVLGDINGFIESLGASLPENEYKKIGKNIWIHKTAQMAPTTAMGGPMIIGPKVQIRNGAFLRGGVILGQHVVIGNSCEIKNSIIFDEAQVPHFNYVGDSILGFVVADYLYRSFPDKPEGELTRIRADLVCEKNLARAAATIRLGSFLLLGHGEEHGGGRKRDSIVSDAMESVIAASYMDGGFSAAKEIIDRLILCDVPAGKPHNFDYKTALQELVQRKKDQVLRYELIGESGPDHDKKFDVEVLLNGKPCGKGTGSSKKRAEQAAAAAAIDALFPGEL